jgi:peptidoglycan/xylan/chitin deacetylase (PgdA/CDA1 family)
MLGHEIGSHTCTHPNLTLLPEAELERELVESRDFLKGLLNKEINTFAYPYTAYNEKVKNVVHKYYDVSRGGGYLYVGINVANRYRVQFCSLYTYYWLLLKGYFSKHEMDNSVIVLHDEKPLKVNILMSLAKLTSPRTEFIPVSEMAKILQNVEN